MSCNITYIIATVLLVCSTDGKRTLTAMLSVLCALEIDDKLPTHRSFMRLKREFERPQRPDASALIWSKSGNEM